VYSITLVVGDSSGDGHEKSENFSFLSSHNAEDIRLAYQSAVELIGVDLCADVCEVYEDCYVSDQDAEKINAALGNILFALYDDRDEEDIKSGIPLRLDTDGFVQVYLAYIKLGNAAIQMIPVEGTRLTIGGYGLFS